MSELETKVDGKNLLQKATDLYFEPKSFEKSGRLYEILGVKQFHSAYVATMGKVVKGLARALGEDGRHILPPYDSSLGAMCKATRSLEGIHLVVAAVFSYGMSLSLSQEDYKTAAFNALANTVVNLYPIMLQRYNRARINRVLERRSQRDE